MRKAKRSRSKPPSRQEDEKNPTVSARVPIEIRGKLQLALRKMDMSLSKLLIAFANEQELKLKPIEEARKAGYEEAKQRYMVIYPCGVCEKPIVLISPKAKTAAGQYMSDAGWGHSECHKKARQSKS